jgi:hypothetical protein
MSTYKESENYVPWQEVIDLDEATAEVLVFDSVVPACCEHGCEVEPDGWCPHGMPSIMFDMGVI